ncbi:MAG: hypothetical protein BYD32DRAFT_434037 [Podila humilis]|nr:MAG: hypothetical protein BYD32DRAFT_434037 [Podila humilis]
MLRTQFFKDIATSADLRAVDLEGDLLAVETISRSSRANQPSSTRFWASLAFFTRSTQPCQSYRVLPVRIDLRPFTQLTVKVPEKGKVKVQISFHDKKGKVKCLILYNVEVSPLEQCVLFTTSVNSIRWITETICFATNFRFFENSV